MAYNPKWNVFNRIIDSDTRIAVIDDVSDSRAFVEIDGTQVADFKIDGLQLASGARVNEFSIDGTLAGDSDTAVPTEAAVKTYVDNQIANLNPDKIWEGDSYVEVVDDGTNAGGYISIVADGVEVANLSDATQRFGQADDTNITITDSTAVIPSGSVEAFGITENGIYVELGETINDFSNDGTLADASATALPTEYAVKTYVDSLSYKIFLDDSYVQVVDDGTANGYVEVVVDGTQVQYWDSQATSIRMGKASGAGRITLTDTTIDGYVGTEEKFYFDATTARLGENNDCSLTIVDSGLTQTATLELGNTNYMFISATGQAYLGPVSDRLDIDFASHIVTIDANSVEVVDLTDNVQRFGVDADTFLSLTQDTNTVDLRANNVSVLNATDTTQRFGASGDTNLTLNTSADTFTLSAGANTQISGGLTSLTMGVAGDTTIALDQTADQVTITAGGESQILVETTGVSVYEDLTVTGNLYVDGTTWVVHNQEVTTSDNLIVINYGEVGPGVTAGFAGLEVDRGTLTDYRFIFDENTDTFRIGEIGALQAVATREDSPVDMTVPWWDDTNKQFKTAGDTAITIDTTSEVIAFTVGASQVGSFVSGGLTLASGATVNEFSTDGTLAGDSNTAIPTEAAVKSYVDAQIGGSADKIWEGDSYVEVVDDGTAAGYITIVADGVEVAHYDALSSTQRIGKAAESRMLVADDTITFYAGASPALQMTLDGNGFSLASGITVNSISDSTNLGSSDATLITQAAATSYIDTGDANTLASAQSYADSGDTSTLASANSYADGVGTATLASANAYTDSAVTDATAYVDSEISTLTSYVDSGLADATAYIDLQDAAVLSDANAYTDQEITALRNELDLINVQYVYSDTTAVSGDVLLVDTTAGVVNIELVEADDSKVVIKKVTGDANGVVVSTSPGTIDGKASITIDTKYQAYHFVSDGSDFFIL